MSLSIIFKALTVATEAHKGQFRNYGGEPYIVHPIAVGHLLASATGDLEVIAAGILHDTLEDTALTEAELEKEFGPRVLALVKSVSKASSAADGNRAARREKDAEHYGKASPEGKTIKLADMADNLKDIAVLSPKFAKLYFKEAAALLLKLKGGDPGLYAKVAGMISDYERSVK
jgi:(p)ppGpp synthase/HD superfamily hydrolase